jgi:hypothetical protein
MKTIAATLAISLTLGATGGAQELTPAQARQARLDHPMTTEQARAIDGETDAWAHTLPVSGADYGSYPSNYQGIIKKSLARTLKDRNSAKYSEFTEPVKEYAIENATEKKAIYGYAVCVLVNAKNSYGGYTGNERHWFFIRNGEVVREMAEGETLISMGHKTSC